MKYNPYLDELVILDDKQKRQLYAYYKLLNEGAKTMNLTTILEEEEVYIKHFYDSIMVLKDEKLQDGIEILDIGTGAGLPGIVLKIVYPKIKVTLLEATQKRCQFLHRVIEELQLDSINVVCERAENFCNQQRASFDFVVARAVANLNMLVELSLPFVKLNGVFIAMKGQNYQKEVDDSKEAIAILEGTVKDKILYNLPQERGMRCLIKIKKVRTTPHFYPRSYAKMKKKPL